MLYEFRVNIFDPQRGEEYPLVQHNFFGRTPKEAHQRFDAHVAVDNFLRAAVEKGMWRGMVLAVDYKMLRRR